MPRSSSSDRGASGPVLLLLGAGMLFLLFALVCAVAGLFLAEPIHALLPPAPIDARAVGGAALALGGASALIGAVHVWLALALRGPRPTLVVPGIVACAVMAVIALGWSVTALVTAASGAAPAVPMLAAGIGLLALATAYGWSTGALLRLREAGRGPI